MTDHELTKAINAVLPEPIGDTSVARRVAGTMPRCDAAGDLLLDGWRWPDGRVAVLDSAGEVLLQIPRPDGDPDVRGYVDGRLVLADRGTLGAWLS